MIGSAPESPRVAPWLRLTGFVAVACVVTACGGKKKPEPELWKKSEVEVKTEGEVGVFTEPTKFEKDVGLHARASADGAIVVSIKNGRKTPIFIQPLSFAVVTGPTPGKDLVVVSAGTADVTKLSAEEIAPSRGTVVSFRLREHPDPRGMRLVMRLPEADLKMFADIE